MSAVTYGAGIYKWIDKKGQAQYGETVRTKFRQSATKKAKQCEADTKRYKESEACFAPYRSNAGSINPEAFQHCVEVKEPTF